MTQSFSLDLRVRVAAMSRRATTDGRGSAFWGQ
jgi:hypothetical protein